MRKIGLLLIALMIALGATGVVFSGWTDTVYITGTAEVGFGEMWLGCSNNPPVYCDAYGMKLDITVTATPETPTPAGSYSCNFDMGNSGSLPLKIQSIDVSDDLPAGTHVSITVEDTQIDPGDVASGVVNIILDEAITEEFDFTVTFNIVLWNKP